MEERIVHRDGFYVVGFRKRITLQFHGENHQIDSLYEQMNENVRRRLLEINDTYPAGIVSVSANFSDRTREGSILDQYLGVLSTKPRKDFESLFVAPADWAVFTSCGHYPDALQETWALIYSEWLGNSCYELTGGPEILWNESDDVHSTSFRSEIWIPVRRKEHQL